MSNTFDGDRDDVLLSGDDYSKWIKKTEGLEAENGRLRNALKNIVSYDDIDDSDALIMYNIAEAALKGESK